MPTSAMRDLAATVLDPETGPAEFRGTAQELAAQVRSAPVNVLRVSVRTLYGVSYLHPENTAADLFAALLRVKNFNAVQVSAIRQLGYEFHLATGELPREFQPRPSGSVNCDAHQGRHPETDTCEYPHEIAPGGSTPAVGHPYTSHS